MKIIKQKLMMTFSVFFILEIFVVGLNSVHAQTILPEGVKLESRVPVGTIPMSSMDLTKNQDFTGNVSIPISLLNIGGFEIQLKYNNKGISDKIRIENQFSPAGSYGLGWDLAYGSISAEINNSADTSDDRYYYNGPDGSFQLQEDAVGVFHIPDYKPWKIQRVMNGNIIAGWIITKEDGTVFRFGNYHRANGVYNFSATNDSTYATRFFLGYDSLVVNPKDSLYSSMSLIPYQWDLSDIEDIGGNHTTAIYQPVLVSLINGSATTGELKYTRESHLYKVMDNKGLEVIFNYGSMGSNEYYSDYPSFIQKLYDSQRLDSIEIKGNSQLVKKYNFSYQSGDILSLGITKSYLSGLEIEGQNGASLPSYNFSYCGLNGVTAGISPGMIKSMTDPQGGKTTYSYKTQTLSNVSLSKIAETGYSAYWNKILDTDTIRWVTNDDGFAGNKFVGVRSTDDSLHIFRDGANGWYDDSSFPVSTSFESHIYNDYITLYDSTSAGVARLTENGWKTYSIIEALQTAADTVIYDYNIIGVYSNYFVVRYNSTVIPADSADSFPTEQVNWKIAVVMFVTDGLKAFTPDPDDGVYWDGRLITISSDLSYRVIKEEIKAYCGENYFILNSYDGGSAVFSHFRFSSLANGWEMLMNRGDSDLYVDIPETSNILFGKNFLLCASDTKIKVYRHTGAQLELIDQITYQKSESPSYTIDDDYFAFTYDDLFIDDSSYGRGVAIKTWNGSSFSTNLTKLRGCSLASVGSRLIISWRDASTADYFEKMGSMEYSTSTGWSSLTVIDSISTAYGSEWKFNSMPISSTEFAAMWCCHTVVDSLYDPVILNMYSFRGNSIVKTSIDTIQLRSQIESGYTCYEDPTCWFFQPGDNYLSVISPGFGSGVLFSSKVYIYKFVRNTDGSMQFSGNPTVTVLDQITLSSGMDSDMVHLYSFQDGIMNEYGTPEYGNVTDTIPGSNGRIKTCYYTSKDSVVSGINYKNLSGLPYDIKEYNSSDNVLRQTQKSWTTVPIDTINGVYFKKLLSESVTTDGVTKAASYTYDDEPYFQVRSVSETNTDGTVRKTTMTYPQNYSNTSSSSDAFVQAIDSMKNSKHICNAVIEKAITNNTGSSVYSGEITEYKLFNGSQILPWKKYGLKSTSSDVITDFTSSSASASSFSMDSRYALLQSFDSYDIYGNPLQTTDANGISTSIKWGYEYSRAKAEIKNAVDGECGFIGLEDGYGDWETGNSSISSNIAHTGLKSSLSNNDFGPTKNFYIANGVDITKTYVLDAWVYKASGTATITIEVRNTSDVNLLNKAAVSTGADGWEHISVKVTSAEMSSLSNINYLRAWCGFEGTGNSGYVDDVRFYPEDAAIVTMTYNPASLLITSKSDENSIPVYIEYDNLGRPSQVYKTIDGVKTLTGGLSYSYSRDTYSEFNSSLPNSKTTILYDGSGNNKQAKEFFDGFNRTIQQQIKDGSSNIIASSTTYDLNNRVDKVFKSYENTSTFGQYDANYSTNADNYCGTTGGYPYSQTSYYSDPLNRVYKQSFPGTQWMMGSGHEKAMSYSSGYGSGLRSAYSSYLYSIETSLDEQPKKTVVYKDNFGRVISSVQDPDALHYETDFEYNLVDKMTKSTDPSSKQTSYVYNTLGQLVQKTSPDAGTVQYKYDKNGNLRFVKDANHTGSSNSYSTGVQVISGVQKITSESFTLGMPAFITLTTELINESGTNPAIKLRIKNNNWGSVALDTIIANASNTSANKSIKLPKGEYFYEVETAGDSASSFSYSISASNNLEFVYKKYDALNRIIEEGEYISTSTANFTSSNAETSTFPSSDAVKYLTAAYVYDDAASTGVSGLTQNNLSNRLSYSKAYNFNQLALTKYYSYDDAGNVEWLLNKLPNSSYTLIKYTHNLQGNVTMEHISGSNDLAELYKFYNYDELGRLTDVITSTDNNKSAGTTEAHYTYLADGSVERLELGTTVQGVDYTYNSRGWLTQINHQNLGGTYPATGLPQDPGCDGFSSGFTVDRFGEVIGYNTQENIGDPIYQNATPQFNGNISWLMYSMYNVTTNGLLAGWSYNYDNANRLTKADYGLYSDSTGSWQTSSAYDMNTLNYDAVGNIDALTRNGSGGSQTNNFDYEYLSGTNKLNYVSGTGSNILISSAEYSNLPSSSNNIFLKGNVSLKAGFATTAGQRMKIGPNVSVENYNYDSNGNMLTDLNSNIAFVLYDIKNLPVRIYFTDNTIANYVYDIDGNRINNIMNNSGYRYIYGANGQTELREKIVNGSVTQVIHNIFGNDLVGTCTVTSTSSEKNYFLKDHLGSIKVIVNEDGSLSSYTDYDPFGLQLENRYTVNNEERYKFTGKERDEETSYDYFGARYYDSRIGRWLQVDPLAEKYTGWSVYNYVRDNPLLLVDPNGSDDDWYQDASGNAQWVDSHEKNLEINGKTYENIGSSYTYKQGNWSYTFNQNELAKVEVNVMSPDQYISQYSLSNPSSACFRASSEMVEPFGITPAGGLSSGDIQISKNGENSATGVNAIENSLFSGNPIVVGEDYKTGSPNADNKTDHFNVVMGASYNLENNTTSFRFFNPGRTTVEGGTSSSNAFNLTPNGLTRRGSYISTVRLNSQIKR